MIVSLVHQDVLRDAFAEVSHFRSELYACLTARGDALFELCDALLCTEGSVRALVDLALAPEHRRGHEVVRSSRSHGHAWREQRCQRFTRLRTAKTARPNRTGSVKREVISM